MNHTVIFYTCSKCSFFLDYICYIIMQKAISVKEYMTSTSSFNLGICQAACLSPLTQEKAEVQKTGVLVKKMRWNSCSVHGTWPTRKSVWVFAFSRHHWGWGETRYLPRETAAACNTWQSSPNFGFTDTQPAAMSLCVHVDSTNWLYPVIVLFRERERGNNEHRSYCRAVWLCRRKLIWLYPALWHTVTV